MIDPFSALYFLLCAAIGYAGILAGYRLGEEIHKFWYFFQRRRRK